MIFDDPGKGGSGWAGNPIFQGKKKRTKRYPQSGALTPNARGQRTKRHPRTPSKKYKEIR